MRCRRMGAFHPPFLRVKRRGLCCRARDEKSTASFRYLKKFCEDCKSAFWRARQFAGAELWNFAASRARELYRGSTLRSWRMIGRDGARRATSLKLARANVAAVPT